MDLYETYFGASVYQSVYNVCRILTHSDAYSFRGYSEVKRLRSTFRKNV